MTGIKNGKLLKKARQEIHVFITIDQNLPYQQELSKYSIAVIALKAKSNRYKDLLAFIKSASEAIKMLRQAHFTKSFLITSKLRRLQG